MADLSKTNNRRGAQDRITQNRDSVLPARRDTRVDDVQVRADMRSAYRDDGNVEELRRFFAATGNALESYYDHDLLQRAETAREDFAQGGTDAAAGREIDPELAESEAYTRAYFSRQAATRQTAWENETRAAVDDMIAQGKTVAEIDDYLTTRSHDFIAETSDVYESPEVRNQINNRLLRWSMDTTTAADTALREKTDKELLDMTVAETQARLQRGEAVDIVAEVEELTLAGINPAAAQDSIVRGIAAYAMQTGDLTGVYAALDARSAEDVALAVEEQRALEANGGYVQSEPIEGSNLPPVEAAPAPEPTRETFAAPVEGAVSSGYGARRAPLPGASTNHQAIDIAVPVGTPVGATASGVVEIAGRSGRGGNTVVIRHADGSKTGFAHLSEINVKVGDTVTQGQVVAKSGNTGNSTGPHLHWTYRDPQGNRRDPRTVVGQEIAGTAAAAADESGVAVAADTVPGERRPRVPGRSILTPDQQVYLLGVVEQVEADSERMNEKARQDARDVLANEFYEASLKGENVDERINQAVQSGLLTAAEGMSYRSAFQSLRNDELDGEANEDLVLDYAGRFAVDRPNYGAITAQADRDYQAGRFGTGRNATRAYLEIKNRAASGARADRAMPVEERRQVTIGRSYLGQAIVRQWGGTRQDLTPAQLRLAAEAQIDWERRVAAGESPMVAADNVIAAYAPRFNNVTPAGDGNPRQPGARQPGARSPNSPAPARRPGTTRVDINGNVIGD